MDGSTSPADLYGKKKKKKKKKSVANPHPHNVKVDMNKPSTNEIKY